LKQPNESPPFRRQPVRLPTGIETHEAKSTGSAIHLTRFDELKKTERIEAGEMLDQSS
jgi:hypothetical protein